ncbi:MAG: PIN domain nuclease [Gammaproteobacteria bacterium]|nr:PIN domain nuclease [Gammaproteobacteria bacterium]
MYLIDTSVWIAYLRQEQNAAVAYLQNILKKQHSFGITSAIYQEILQGASSVKDFARLTDYFSTQHFYHPLEPVTSYENAAQLYFTCRKQGVTIRSTIDCLIAQIAIEHNLVLLHNDKDFEDLSKIAAKLNLVKL